MNLARLRVSCALLLIGWQLVAHSEAVSISMVNGEVVITDGVGYTVIREGNNVFVKDSAGKVVASYRNSGNGSSSGSSSSSSTIINGAGGSSSTVIGGGGGRGTVYTSSSTCSGSPRSAGTTASSTLARSVQAQTAHMMNSMLNNVGVGSGAFAGAGTGAFAAAGSGAFAGAGTGAFAGASSCSK